MTFGRWVNFSAMAGAWMTVMGTTLSVSAGAADMADKPRQVQDEDLLWLEDIEGEKALDWVREQNRSTLEELTKDPRFDQYKQEALAILTAPDRIAAGRLRGGYVYNFWQDESHVRGIWRRAPIETYKAGAPEWEVLLDVDDLARREGKNWIFKGADCLAPAFERCILSLSPGGTDAAVYREFDIPTKDFVKDGFYVPLAKSSVGWQDENTLLVATDWGEGSLNTSGYARILKRWQRGTPMTAADPLLEMAVEETFVFPVSFDRPEGGANFIMRGHDFYRFTYYVVDDTGGLKQLPLPPKSDLSGMFEGQVLVTLKEDWQGHRAGSLISFDLAAFMEKGQIDHLHQVFDPGLEGTIERVVTTRDAVYVQGLEHVSSRLREFRLVNGAWTGRSLAFGDGDVISLMSADPRSNDLLLSRDGLLTPDSLYWADFVKGDQKLVQSLPPRFDSTGLKVEKKFATSRDGTRIPYFLVYHNDSPMDGTTPVLQYGYGGFEISILPHYRPLMGKLWLEKGGAYVIANIRGGGEYGPRWHEAALLENRQRAYDDFFAVAEAVQKSGLSSPRHYGAIGRSNGGLLMGVAFTQRPDLFNAIVCGVPLLDMKRYNKLLAGASWMAEYGNPDNPEHWAFIKEYSPFQNLRADVDYPKVYFFTSTKDDRVHPGHARKMAAKMGLLGHDYYYYENIEGGHKGDANHEQEATMRALEYLYLKRHLEKE
ncbi:prolyl oligopeptidase family serine peptidase [Luteithermobacter gelatinilyticus]|uniref:prolyl oligopeptidase family serine peptidase n=1 Tax=Luteithermobacter gelatinilyticus TaxID=2582913 RepID=UPI0011068C16|nr:prolyl oligopeptidase family serine peptidase [Luteithermobacter gelatinilyticus]